eukprot:1799839-Prymnesium_polylepis.1
MPVVAWHTTGDRDHDEEEGAINTEALNETVKEATQTELRARLEKHPSHAGDLVIRRAQMLRGSVALRALRWAWGRLPPPRPEEPIVRFADDPKALGTFVF